MASHLRSLLHFLGSGRKVRAIHAVATAGFENHGSLSACESGGKRFLARAPANAYDAMSEPASQALRKDEEPAPKPLRGLEPQSV
jgi:hypothetical protein